MNWLKLIVFAIVVILVVMLGISVIGLIYSALWYLLVLGILAIGGYVGYKVLAKGKSNELDGRDSISQIELENAKIIKNLEDFKNMVKNENQDR